MPESISFNVVDLGQLFAAPLRALIGADALASREFAAFLGKYGFVRQMERSVAATDGGEATDGGASAQPTLREGEDDDLGELRMVSFRIPQAASDGGIRWARVEVPVLSLIPLPLLQVEDADVKFAIRIVEVRKHQGGNTSLELLRDAEDDEPPWLEWRAMLADRQLDSPNRSEVAPQLNANVQAHVRMRRADIPPGIATLLGLLGEATLIERP